MTKGQEGGKNQINSNNSSKNDTPDINRGFELMLRHRSRREKRPESKTFGIKIQKVISLLKREIDFRFELSLLVKKKP